jgi:phage protein U
MLYLLGAVRFEVWPVNAEEVERETGADFAEKPVIGRRPILEFVGEGSETITLSGRLFPEKLGGSLEMLQAQRAAGRAVPLMRGDGRPFGWVVIERVSESSSRLMADGVGRMIEFNVSVRRSEAPGAGGYFGIISGLFG